jgi:hypothetical protein
LGQAHATLRSDASRASNLFNPSAAPRVDPRGNQGAAHRLIGWSGCDVPDWQISGFDQPLHLSVHVWRWWLFLSTCRVAQYRLFDISRPLSITQICLYFLLNSNFGWVHHANSHARLRPQRREATPKPWPVCQDIGPQVYSNILVEKPGTVAQAYDISFINFPRISPRSVVKRLNINSFPVLLKKQRCIRTVTVLVQNFVPWS